MHFSLQNNLLNPDSSYKMDPISKILIHRIRWIQPLKSYSSYKMDLNFWGDKLSKSHLIAELHKTTVKILKIGTPEIITIIILQFEQLDFTVQYCVQKMQTE